MLGWLFDRINIWTILLAIAVAGGLVLLVGLIVLYSPPPVERGQTTSLAITIIPAPTQTNTPAPTNTPEPTEAPVVGGISVGSYVQIAGTEGAGLRLRSGPGTANPPRFLGMDSEVFMVKDGPRESDDITWWFLEAPYDPNRSGWAAGSYLQVINNPTSTP